MIKSIPYYLIESFLMTAEKSSLQEAADILGITQSTLSKQMILFEELLPHKVFAFEGRRKTLTQYGKSLYEALKPKFFQTQEIIEQTSKIFSRPENLQLRICGRGELLDMLAINLKFEGNINFIPMNNESAVESILNRKSDIAIVHSAVNNNEVIMIPLLKNNFKFAISKSLLNLRPRNEVEIVGKMRKFPGLVYKLQDPVLENLTDSWKMKLNEIKTFRVYPNYTTLARMVSEGLGWAILPSHIEIDDKINYVIPINATSVFDRKFYLLYRKDLKSANWLKELVANIKQAANS